MRKCAKRNVRTFRTACGAKGFCSSLEEKHLKSAVCGGFEQIHAKVCEIKLSHLSHLEPCESLFSHIFAQLRNELCENILSHTFALLCVLPLTFAHVLYNNFEKGGREITELK